MQELYEIEPSDHLETHQLTEPSPFAPCAIWIREDSRNHNVEQLKDKPRQLDQMMDEVNAGLTGPNPVEQCRLHDFVRGHIFKLSTLRAADDFLADFAFFYAWIRETAPAIRLHSYRAGPRSVVVLWTSHGTETHQETGYATVRHPVTTNFSFREPLQP